MPNRLPPPDPHESLGLSPETEMPLASPTVLYAAGKPSNEVDRIADAIVELRPGALIVFARD
jgi:hypothetical protein